MNPEPRLDLIVANDGRTLARITIPHPTNPQHDHTIEAEGPNLEEAAILAFRGMTKHYRLEPHPEATEPGTGLPTGSLQLLRLLARVQSVDRRILQPKDVEPLTRYALATLTPDGHLQITDAGRQQAT